MQDTAFGVKGVIIKEDKCLILVKPNGRIDLPGGRIDFNESPEEALLREIFEETGIADIKILNPVTHWSFIKNPKLKIHGITYICSYHGGDILLSKEHKDYIWQRVDAIHKLAFNPPYVG